MSGREIVHIETRFSALKRKFFQTRAGSLGYKLWKDWISYYGTKTWGITKTVLWLTSSGALMSLLPLGLEATIEGEAQAARLQDQLGGMNPDIQYRSY